MTRTPRPPVIPGLLLRLWLSNEAQETLVGDMREEYARRAHMNGHVRAWLWYWRETVSAIAAFGGRKPSTERLKGDPYVRSFFSDLRIGARSVFSAPLTSTLSIGTLALGIGAIAAVFSVVNPILLRPLPYPEPDQLVFVTPLDRNNAPNNIGFTTFDDLRRDYPAFRESAVMGNWQPTLGTSGDAERLNGQRVSWNFFRLLGVRPMLGRDFTEAEDAPDQRTIILGYGVWRRHFGADSGIVGRTIDIGGSAFTVAGVMGPDFQNVASPRSEIWRTMSYATNQPWACRTCQHLRMITRLPDGMTLAAAEAEASAAARVLFEKFPKEYAGPGMRVLSLKERMTAPFKDALFVLFGAAALLALIATANVVNLQLGRAIERQGAIAVRLMLGATRARIVRLLFAEGLVLATIAGVAGAALAWVFVPLFASHLPAGIPRLSTVAVDTQTVLLLVLCSFVVAIAVTLVPALRMDTTRMGGAMRVAKRVVGSGSAVVRRSLVIGEVALALMLLAATGLLSRSLSALLAVDPGVDAANVLTMEVQSTGTRYATREAILENHRQIVEGVRAVPGVVEVGFSNQIPLGGNGDSYGIRAFDKPLDNPSLAPDGDRYVVNPGYFKAIGTRIVRGRGFTDADNSAGAIPVAMVSEALAQTLWPGEDPIGKRIQMGEATSPWREIIGIVENVHHRALDNDATRQFYVPEHQWSQFTDAVVVLAVRTTDDPMLLMPAVRAAIRAVDASQPIMRVRPMTEIVSTSIGQRSLAFTMFAIFAGVSILLAAGGVYGVLATAVAARSREIGVRSALGATPGRLLGLVARDSAWLVCAGVVLGVAGVIALSRFLTSLLYGIQPNDPVTIVVVTIGVGAAAMSAAIVPALRAARTDPVVVLRGE
jgi:putative ABC transport system permease protein